MGSSSHSEPWWEPQVLAGMPRAKRFSLWRGQVGRPGNSAKIKRIAALVWVILWVRARVLSRIQTLRCNCM